MFLLKPISMNFWLLKDYEFLSTAIISMISSCLLLMVSKSKVKNQQECTQWIVCLWFVLEFPTLANVAAGHSYFNAL